MVSLLHHDQGIVTPDAVREQEKIERSQRRSMPQIDIDKPSHG
jgi:hypothetical protein